jgi:hypothetical protein
MLRLPRRTLLLAMAGALAAGCLSPTLPLPPPSPPDVAQIGQGVYRLSGSIPVPGTVLVQNSRTNLVYGKVVTAVYELTVDARPGDPMLLWYESSGDASETIGFRIDGALSPPVQDAGSAGGGGG